MLGAWQDDQRLRRARAIDAGSVPINAGGVPNDRYWERGRMINAYGVQERSTLSAWHHDHRQGHGKPVNAHSKLPPLMA
jgi:hypothetical protein